MNIPTLHTERLILRPLASDDSHALTLLLSDGDVVSYMVTVPHILTELEAYAYIADIREKMAAGAEAYFAITRPDDNLMMGAVALHIQAEHRRAELGYWLGTAYRGKGYMREAVARVVRYAFEELNLNRLYGYAMTHNAASITVMEQAGFRYEGTLRQDTLRDTRRIDVSFYGLLREEYQG